MKISYELISSIDRCCKFTRKLGVFLSEFSHLCFRADQILAYNGFSGIIHLMGSSKFGEKQEVLSLHEDIAVPSEMISKLLHSFESGLEITVEGKRIAKNEEEAKEGKTLLVRSGKKFISRLSTPYINKNLWDFKKPNMEEMTLLDEEFFPCIRKIYFSVCKDETKPYMKGIYCDGDFLYSTDDYRIARYPFKFENIKDLVIPDALLELIIDESTPAGYSITGETEKKLWLLFEERFLVFVNAFNLKFPNCKVLFESIKVEEEVEFDSEEFMKVLRRFDLLVPTWPQKVILVMKPPSKILVTATGPGLEAIEEFQCKVGLQKERACAFNLKFLKDAVEHTNRFSVMDEFLYFKSVTESKEENGETKQITGLETVLRLLDPVNEEAVLKKVNENLSEQN